MMGRFLLPATIIIWGTVPMMAWGEPPGISGLAYRRLFVSADAPESWPVGSQRYLAIRESKFSSLYQQAVARRMVPARPGLTPRSIFFRAHLTPIGNRQIDRVENNQTGPRQHSTWSLGGTALLDVVLPGNSPELLWIDPWSLAVTEAHWTGPAEDESTRPAQLGMWQQPGQEKSQLGVMMDRPGPLEIQWQIACRSQTAKNVEFAFRTPPAVKKRMELELPEKALLNVTGGIVLGHELGKKGIRLWHMELGASTHQVFSISRLSVSGRLADKDRSTHGGSIPPRVQQSTDYRISPAGLDMKTTVQLDSPMTEPADLRMRILGAADISSVVVDGHDAEWNILSTNGLEQLQIPMAAGASNVRVQAMAPLSMASPWQLPTLHSSSLTWTQGEFDLSIDPYFELQSFTPKECSVTHAEIALDGEILGSRYILQKYSERASLNVLIGKQSPRLHVQTAMITSWRDKSTIGRMVGLIHSDHDGQFFVDAQVAEDWNILSVETRPLDSLAGWHCFEEDNRRVVRIQLSHALRPSEPVRIELDGRRDMLESTGSTRQADVRSLQMIHFQNMDTTRQLLLLQPQKGFRCIPENAALDAVLTDDFISALDAQMLPQSWHGVLLDQSKLRSDATIGLQPEQIDYQGNVISELSVLTDAIEHQWTIECMPKVGAIAVVNVRFSQPVPNTITWEILDDQEGVPLDSQRKATFLSIATSDNSHRLRLPAATEHPFRLQARILVSREQLPSKIQPNLASLPEASNPRSWIVFRGDPQEVRADRCGATPVAIPVSDHRSSAPILSCYRLDSAASVLPENQPTLIRSESPRNPESTILWNDREEDDWTDRLFARYAEMDLLYGEDGIAISRIEYHLDNQGETRLEFSLPPTATLQSVWRDSVLLDLPNLVADNTKVIVPIDARDQQFRLVLHYIHSGQPLGLGASFRPDSPRESFPVMQGHWTLWTSQPYRAMGMFQDAWDEQVGWSRRLFGHLARRQGERGFHPWQAGDWKSLWDNSSERSNEDHHIKRQPDSSDWRMNGLLPGWHACRSDYVGHPASVHLVRADAVKAIWVAVWFLAAVLGTWQLARKTFWMAMAILLVTILSLFAPQVLAHVSQALFLGLLTSIFLRSILFHRGYPTAGSPASVTTGLLVLSWATTMPGLPCDAHAGDAHGVEASRAVEPVHRILIPMESVHLSPDGTVVGDRSDPKDERREDGDREIYIPESLYHHLADSNSTERTLSAWVLTRARYYGTLRRTTQQRGPSKNGYKFPQVVCENWRIVLDVTSMRDHCKLILPLWRDDADWQVKEHRLNGAPVELDWLSSGEGCQILLPRQGDHRLEIVLIPHLLRKPRTASLRITVPKVVDSSLNLQTPDAISGIRIPSAVDVEHSSDGRSLQANLPPSGLLEIHWTPAHRTCDPNKKCSAEQLLWLNVQPDRSLLDVRLRVHSEAGPMPTLQLEADSQLELLPPESNSPILRMETSPDLPGDYRLEIRADVRSPVEIPLHFRIKRSTPVGRITFPQVRPVNVPVTESLMGVSVGAGLSYHEEREGDPEQQGSGLEVLSPKEFVAKWGDSRIEPLFAYSISRERPDWSLQVMPDPISFAATQFLQLRCNLDKTDVHYRAQIDEVAGNLFVHRLFIFPELQIDQISLRMQSGGEEIPIRWGRTQMDRTQMDKFPLDLLTLFLSRPADGLHQVVLKGSIPQSLDLPTSVACVRLPQAHSNGLKVELTRSPDVLVQCEGSVPGQIRVEGTGPLEADQKEMDGILVGNFSMSHPGEKPWRIIVTANKHRLKAKCLTLLEEQEGKIMKEDHAQTFSIAEDSFSARQQTFAITNERADLRFAEIRGAINELGRWSATAELILQPGRASTCFLQLPPRSKLLQISIGSEPVPKRQIKPNLWTIPLGPPTMPRRMTVDYTSMASLQNGILSLEAPKVILGRQTLCASASHWQIQPVGPIRLGTAIVGFDQKAATFDWRGDAYRLAVVEEASAQAFQLPLWEARQWFLPWQDRLEKSHIFLQPIDALDDSPSATTSQLDVSADRSGVSSNETDPFDEARSSSHNDSTWHLMVSAFGRRPVSRALSASGKRESQSTHALSASGKRGSQSTHALSASGKRESQSTHALSASGNIDGQSMRQPDLNDLALEDPREPADETYSMRSNSLWRSQSSLIRHYAGGPNGQLTVEITPLRSHFFTCQWASPQWSVPRFAGVMVMGVGIWVAILLAWRHRLGDFVQWFQERSCPPCTAVFLVGGAWWIWLTPSAVGFGIMVLGLAAMVRSNANRL